MSDLTATIQEQIAEAMANAQAQATGRSPMRPRQLTDLRLAPTATDPRPLFIPSAESPRNVDVTRTSPYPRLLWHQGSGEERTVRTAADAIALGDDWGEVPPVQAPVDPIDAMRAVLADLTPEERQLVLDAQRDDRLRAIQAKLAALAPADLSAVLEDAVAKRGPGRPRKTA